MDNGRCCGVLFLDLKKAFDTVNHDILLQKLEGFGVEGTERLWFHSYLTNRMQRTIIDGSLSDPRTLTCGVPQGSILGPLLFILYINDLPDSITKCSVMLYADDTALYFSHRDPAAIERILNVELASVSEWFQVNRLTLNAGKTKFMIFGTSKRLTSTRELIVRILNETIEHVKVFKCLDV